MKIGWLSLFFVTGYFIVGCQTTPTAGDLANAYDHMQSQQHHEFAGLEARRKVGQLTSEQYEYEKSVIQNTLAARANDRVLTEHQLEESYQAALGMPRPGTEHKEVDFPSGPAEIPGQVRPGFDSIR